MFSRSDSSPAPDAPPAANTGATRDPAQALAHVRHWVFDLDNTLYPPEARLFDQIEVKMTDWVMRSLNLDRAAADRLRKDYWRDHGTTLAGLMKVHDIDPGPYMTEVHRIDMSHLDPDPVLASRIRALPGRRIVYTNGSAPYAEEVLEARGLSGLFDAIYGVEHADWLPKPEAAAFEKIFTADGVDRGRAAMFEDDARNLVVPHAMGLGCVHVSPAPAPAPHIHFHTDNLSEFLSRVI